jgi:abortive infection bacteriophage resistance protein
MSKPYCKTPLTINQQIIQMEDRGMNFIDKKKAEFFLLHNNYYKFSFYYKKFSENKTHIISDSSSKSFDFYHDLYLQDRVLGGLLLKYIAILEDSLRTQYAYYFSTKTGDAHPHLNSLNFDKDYNELKSALLNTFNGSLLAYKEHYQTNYIEELPPIWVLVESLPLGLLYRTIKRTKKVYTEDLYNSFNYDSKLLDSFFYSLSFVRNLCAHNSIIWNINNDKLPKIPKINNVNETIIAMKNSKTLKKINPTDSKQIINFIVILYYLLQQIKLEQSFQDDFNDFFNSLEEKYLKGYGALERTPLVL